MSHTKCFGLVVFICAIAITGLDSAQAKTYYSEYGRNRTHNITLGSSGTHSFQVNGIARYRTTEWYVNGNYTGTSENDKSGFWAIDPEYTRSFAFGTTTSIIAQIYDSSWNPLEKHTWNVTVAGRGQVRCYIEPSGARSAGAQWRLTSGPDTSWKNSGVTSDLIPTGSYTVEFRSVSKWNKPSNRSVTVYSGSATIVRVTYSRQVGSVRGYIEPSGARSADARWQLTSGPDTGWKSSGSTISNVPTGNYTMRFKSAPGAYSYRTPSSQSVSVSSGIRTTKTGIYVATRGDLRVTVKNQNGSTKSSGAEVVLYTKSWAHLDTKPAPSYWSLTPGPYQLEAYYNGEYWVNDSVTVSAGKTEYKTLQRNEPYAYDFKVYKISNNQDVTGSTLDAGTPLRYEVKVRNSSPVNRTVKVKIWIDRNKTSPYDFYQISTSQTVLANGKTRTFTFAHTPNSSTTQTYYRRLEVQTYVNNKYAKTDSWAWGTAFTAQTVADNASIVSFSPPTGDVIRGSQAQATVRVKNTGSAARRFWIGLSFAGPGATLQGWPDGWYDVKPKQTEVLSPGSRQDVVFTFEIPYWLPEGDFSAVTAVWDGYEVLNNIMVLPEYDRSSLDNAFRTHSLTDEELELVGVARAPVNIRDLESPYYDVERIAFNNSGVTVSIERESIIPGIDLSPRLAEGAVARIKVRIDAEESEVVDYILGVNESQLIWVFPANAVIGNAYVTLNGQKTVLQSSYVEPVVNIGLTVWSIAKAIGGPAGVGAGYVIKSLVKSLAVKAAEDTAKHGLSEVTDYFISDLPVALKTDDDCVVWQIDFSRDKWKNKLDNIAKFSSLELGFDLGFSGKPAGAFSLSTDIRSRLSFLRVVYEGLVALFKDTDSADSSGTIIRPLVYEARRQYNIYPSALGLSTPISLSVTPNSSDVSSSGGAATFLVSNIGNGTMPWTAEVIAGGSWLSIISGSSGTNSGTITASCSANSVASSRTGTIRITSVGATGSPTDLTIIQAGNEYGSLRVTISPQEAINAGAKWRVDSGAWQGSGGTQSNLSVGSHTVEFKETYAGCWFKPANISVQIHENQTATITGEYTVCSKVVTPVISSNDDEVTIVCSTSGATIYYTTDGVTTPTKTSTQYNGPFTVSSSVTIMARAYMNDYIDSDVTAPYEVGPDERAITVGGAIYTDIDYPVPSGLDGVTVTLTGTSETLIAITRGNQGIWDITVPQGPYVVVPSKSGYEFEHVAGGVVDEQPSISITVNSENRGKNLSIQFWAYEVEPWLPCDINDDGIVSIIGDVEPFVDCVYFGNCPGDVAPRCDINDDGIVSIIGDVEPFVDCVYFGNCPE